VGDRAFIGIGSTVIDKIRIGEDCIIGGGSVVVDDIPARTVAYGVPAKVRRHL
jgi:acetyltransferase-like isoleucine patch superfamily enzyme